MDNKLTGCSDCRIFIKVLLRLISGVVYAYLGEPPSREQYGAAHKKRIEMLRCTKHIAVRTKAIWFRQLTIVRTMPSPKTYTSALEAAEAPQTSTDTATKVAPKSAEKAQHLVEKTARTAQSAVQQQAGQKNLDLALQLTGTAVSS